MEPDGAEVCQEMHLVMAMLVQQTPVVVVAQRMEALAPTTVEQAGVDLLWCTSTLNEVHIMKKFWLLLVVVCLAQCQTITTIQPTDLLSNSRATLNTNFSELNTYTMKNHVFNDLLLIATPGTSPATGYLRVYAKTGSGICWKTSAGVETCAGAGGVSTVTEAELSLTDITTWNASITAHGFMPKLTGSTGVVMSGAGTWIVIPGGGNVVGPAAGTGGELTTVSAGGTVLTRSALTGVLKATAGVPAAVTGTATDCVRVNGTSGACSGGVTAASDLTDFLVTLSTTSVTDDTVNIAAGHARVGNYSPTHIALGKIVVTGGSGDVKLFIDSANNLVCYKETAGAIATTVTGSVTCSNVATPAYPAGSIPLYDLAVSAAQAVSIDADDRAFLSTKPITAGTGIIVTESSGGASVAIDPATVPQLGGTNAFTGEVDFTGTTALYIRRGSGAPTAGECDAAAEVGQLYGRSDAAAAGASLYVCANTGAATYAWEIAAGGGTGLGATTVFAKSIGLFDPVAGDSGRIQFSFGQAVTILRVYCSTKTATSTVTLNLDERAEATPDTAGTNVLSADLVADTGTRTSCASGCDVNTITNAGIAANAPVALTIASVANAPTDLRCHVNYQFQ
jgi:hypothetical protein